MNDLLQEIWNDIQGYEGLYQVSNFGRVKSLERKIFNGENYHISKEKILSPGKDKDGYFQVQLYKEKTVKMRKIHRLVAEAFIPNPNNYPQVNHKDEDKQNNRIDNLEWCDGTYNQNYGTSKIRRGKPVMCTTTGLMFNTLSEAAKYYGINNKNDIGQACRKERRKYCGVDPSTGKKLEWEFIYIEDEFKPMIRHLQDQIFFWQRIALAEREKNIKLEEIIKKIEEKIYNLEDDKED